MYHMKKVFCFAEPNGSWFADCHWELKNWCFWTVVLEETLESPLDCKEIQPVHPKGDESWVFIGRTDVEAETLILWPPILWCKELTHLKRPWCWEILRAGGEGDNRGWHGWMASPTQWTWVWVNSRNWWWTGRPGVLQSMGVTKSRTATELNWTQGGKCTLLGTECGVYIPDNHKNVTVALKHMDKKSMMGKALQEMPCWSGGPVPGVGLCPVVAV